MEHEIEFCDCCGCSWRQEPEWMDEIADLERAAAPQWALEWEDTLLERLKLETFIGDKE